MIKRLVWIIWTPMSSVLKKADKLNLSLSLSLNELDEFICISIEVAFLFNSMSAADIKFSQQH